MRSNSMPMKEHLLQLHAKENVVVVVASSTSEPLAVTP